MREGLEGPEEDWKTWERTKGQETGWERGSRDAKGHCRARKVF